MSFRAVRGWLLAYLVLYPLLFLVGADVPYDVAGIGMAVGVCVVYLYSHLRDDLGEDPAHRSRRRELALLQTVLLIGPIAWFVALGDALPTIAGSAVTGVVATAGLERLRRRTTVRRTPR